MRFGTAWQPNYNASLTTIGIGQHLTLIFQLNYVFTIWADLASTSRSAAAKAYTRGSTGSSHTTHADSPPAEDDFDDEVSGLSASLSLCPRLVLAMLSRFEMVRICVVRGPQHKHGLTHRPVSRWRLPSSLPCRTWKKERKCPPAGAIVSLDVTRGMSGVVETAGSHERVADIARVDGSNGESTCCQESSSIH